MNAPDASFDASLGASKLDAHPGRHGCPSFADLVALIDANRTARKGGRFICGTFSDGHRSKATAEPRAWLALDIDGGSLVDIETAKSIVAQCECCWWHTHSHKPDSQSDGDHRLRVVVALSRSLDRDEQDWAGKALADLVLRDAPSLKFDGCTYRPEQPCYLPAPGVEIGRGGADPFDVDWLLEHFEAIKPAKHVEPPRAPVAPSTSAQIRQCEAALDVLHPDALPASFLGVSSRYDGIFHIIAAAKAAGISLAKMDEWCSRGPDYPGSSEIAKRYESVTPGAINAGTLLGAASEIDPGWRSRYWQSL